MWLGLEGWSIRQFGEAVGLVGVGGVGYKGVEDVVKKLWEGWRSG